MSNGTIYSVTFKGLAVTAAIDLFEILAPTRGCVEVHAWNVFQTSDTGDAAEEILPIEVTRGELAVTSGSGGITMTPRPQDHSAAAFGGTVEAQNTTRMSAGSPDELAIIETHGWNVRVPYTWVYTPELRPVIRPGRYLTLGLPSAPADSLTMGATIWFEAKGGA